MSDSYISIVPEQVEKAKANKLAEKVVNWLISRKIIKAELTDCTLGNDGHEPDENFKEVVEDEKYWWFIDLDTNGLEVITEKYVFHNGGNGLEEITCPNCKTNIIETDWGEAVDEWVKETGLDKVTCPNCQEARSITEYNFEPAWGFGELGFTFWNWQELKEDFIKEIEALLNSKVKLIYGRL